MHVLAALLLFLAPPFWEAKPPEKWTSQEIETLRFNSPWAQSMGPAPAMLVYFATSAPIEDAEAELRVRGRNPLREPDADYLTYLSENREKNFVLAISYGSPGKAAKAGDEKRMEDESEMVIGRKRYKMIGHFPPVEADPVLRLVFPREIQPGDRRVVFRLYVPGVEFPDRQVEFNVKELMYHGRLEV